MYGGDGEKKGFKRLDYPTSGSFEDYFACKGHKSLDSCKFAENRWGLNVLDIPVQMFSDLFAEHATAPFFVFQVFVCILWSLDEYWYYSLFTLLMLIVFESALCWQRLQNLEVLRNMRRPAYAVHVYRAGRWTKISTDHLLPGDLMSLTSTSDSPFNKAEELLVACDILLLRGGCVVNEAMLTGESMPQVKEAAPCFGHFDGIEHMNSSQRRHTVFAGTKVLQHSASQAESTSDENNGIPAPPDKGCLCFVLRTGFETSQGQLLRTIMYSSQRVTVEDSAETGVFIGILVLFALVAAAYVLHEGLKDDTRNRLKLALHCIMIVTSVVPPELPMELSLAVNTSLLALQELGINCTEPFRVPLAGKVDTCCFDKTGTLTSDNLILMGVARAQHPATLSEVTEAKGLNCDELRVMAGCQSLVPLRTGLAGDPLESATLEGIEWRCVGHGRVIPNSTAYAKGSLELFVMLTYPFDAALRRMTTIVAELPKHVNVLDPSTIKTVPVLWALSKGAPEEMQALFVDAPPSYKSTYIHHMSSGRRVLALGYRKLDTSLSSQTLKKYTRTQAEAGLHFAGFLILKCPLKGSAALVVRELKVSSHGVVMITGDSALTAADVARQVGIIETAPESTLFLGHDEEGLLHWDSLTADLGDTEDKTDELPIMFKIEEVHKLAKKYSLCMSGDSMTTITKMSTGRETSVRSQGPESVVSYVEHDPANVGLSAMERLTKVVPYISVFARVSPDQKEVAIAAMNAAGRTTLMCGDGTNDVGALKRSHVGVSIVNCPQVEKKLQRRHPKSSAVYGTGDDLANMNQTAMSEIYEQSVDPLLVQLGDASIASPFTAKTTSIGCVLAIVRQGRCTLVTTLQIYKILAVNCLTSAYMLSCLHLWGVKQGDGQMTILGLAIALFFFALSGAKSLEKLSAERPPTRIFALPVVLSIWGQFCVHLCALGAMQLMCNAHIDPEDPSLIADSPFRPNTFNSAVFLLSCIIQANTFVANYSGHPFKQALKDNKILFRSLLAFYSLIYIATAEVCGPLQYWLELSPWPNQKFKTQFFCLLLMDTIICMSIVRVTDIVAKFFQNRTKEVA